MSRSAPIASIVMAAGRGSRMKGYSGNKTLLPLRPSADPFVGRHPLLHEVLRNLPQGAKALIVNHCRADVLAATTGFELSYCLQPVLDGTGGAILAAADFVARQDDATEFIITMGDVPFVRTATYARLVDGLASDELIILGFRPADKKKYGVLEIEAGRIRKITEWQYWKDYPAELQERLDICNSGIYAVRKQILSHYLPILASRPRRVYKEIDGRQTAINEFFITDLIEYMVADGRSVGFVVTDDALETMGIDDPDALQQAQTHFNRSR